MEKLKNFEANVINTSLIYGGKWKTSGSNTSTNSNGCTVTTSESYDDANGDEVHNEGESTTVCISTQC